MGEQTELFIEKVREHSYLYDTSDKEYKNVVKKAEAWNQIAGEMNMTSDAARSKWKGLRDCYLKYKKCLVGVTGQAKKYHNWPWGAHFQFLDVALKTRPRSSNVTLSVSSPSSIESEDSDSLRTETPPPIIEQTKEDTDRNIHLSPASLKMPPPLPKKIRKIESQENACTDVDKVIDFLKRKPDKRECDGIDHLFLSYADTFKKFQPATQAVMKMELANLFAQTELKELRTRATPGSSSPFDIDYSSQSTTPSSDPEQEASFATNTHGSSFTNVPFSTASEMYEAYGLQEQNQF